MRYIATIASIAMLLILHSCGSKKSLQESTAGAVYYWRTTLQLDSAERQFLSDNNIDRIYMRYFDVDMAGGARPVATIRFNDSLPPGIEVVPVVFITQRAIEEMGHDPKTFAQKIWTRVKAMSQSQGWELHELQLDCDWTASTRNSFFKLCKAVAHLVHADGAQLSSTIRLHQLKQKAPPVDKGVLMVYNTGSFKAITAKNSIFDPSDIKPYLTDKRLAKYKLPLDVAWPTYGWGVAFDSNGKFKYLLRTTNLDNTPDVENLGGGRYQAQGADIDGHNLWGTIRVERPEYDDIMNIKKIIDKQLGTSHRNIIYHLDNNQFKYYKDEELKNILFAD